MSESPHCQPPEFLVRVFSRETFLGTGLAVTPHHVLTCRHCVTGMTGDWLPGLSVRRGATKSTVVCLAHDGDERSFFEKPTPQQADQLSDLAILVLENEVPLNNPTRFLQCESRQHWDGTLARECWEASGFSGPEKLAGDGADANYLPKKIGKFKGGAGGISPQYQDCEGGLPEGLSGGPIILQVEELELISCGPLVAGILFQSGAALTDASFHLVGRIGEFLGMARSNGLRLPEDEQLFVSIAAYKSGRPGSKEAAYPETLAVLQRLLTTNDAIRSQLTGLLARIEVSGKSDAPTFQELIVRLIARLDLLAKGLRDWLANRPGVPARDLRELISVLLTVAIPPSLRVWSPAVKPGDSSVIGDRLPVHVELPEYYDEIEVVELFVAAAVDRPARGRRSLRDRRVDPGGVNLASDTATEFGKELINSLFATVLQRRTDRANLLATADGAPDGTASQKPISFWDRIQNPNDSKAQAQLSRMRQYMQSAWLDRDPYYIFLSEDREVEVARKVLGDPKVLLNLVIVTWRNDPNFAGAKEFADAAYFFSTIYDLLDSLP